MSKELATVDYDKKEVKETIRATVAQGATDAELAMFLELAKATGLNPYKKEIWFIKTKGYTKKDGKVVEPKVQIMTGLNGFLAIANSHPQFDGMECDVDYGTDGLPRSATAKVWRKDRRFPSLTTALWSEYYKPNPYGNKGIWEQMPSIMLAKCAKSLALREAFPQELNGLYTQEEMPADFAKIEGEQPKLLASIKTADQLQQQTTKQVFKNDDIEMTAAAKPQGVFTYDLKSHLEGLGVDDYNKKLRFLERKQGIEISEGVWNLPEYIDAMKDFLLSSSNVTEAA